MVVMIQKSLSQKVQQPPNPDMSPITNMTPMDMMEGTMDPLDQVVAVEWFSWCRLMDTVMENEKMSQDCRIWLEDSLI